MGWLNQAKNGQPGFEDWKNDNSDLVQDCSPTGIKKLVSIIEIIPKQRHKRGPQLPLSLYFSHKGTLKL